MGCPLQLGQLAAYLVNGEEELGGKTADPSGVGALHAAQGEGNALVGGGWQRELAVVGGVTLSA